MNFIECSTIYIIVIITTPIITSTIQKVEDHLCKETFTRLLDDGYTYNEEVLVCCPGYIEDTTGKCIPFCQSPCIHGFCKTPNVCDCNEGYEKKKNECVPICKNKCFNGYCSKPNVCNCPNGFELDPNNLTSCLPICNPKCDKFSKCIKSIPPTSNRCLCIAGYSKNKTSEKCEPVCKNKCYNGFCRAPNMCGCFDGYELDKPNKTNCIAKCEPRCQLFSSCMAPNTCNCNNGYKLNEISKKCEPLCDDQVRNSRCIKPPNTWTCIENYQHDRRIDKCVLESCLCKSNGYCLDYKDNCTCYEGFTKNFTTGQCDAICKPHCENSVCIANNICQCIDGHHITSANHICERNDLCKSKPCKNGECLITGECKCKSGYVKSFSYKGEHQCDKVQTFIGKVMTTVIGVPLLLAICALIGIYVIAKKKSYNMEEQEMVLIHRQ